MSRFINIYMNMDNIRKSYITKRRELSQLMVFSATRHSSVQGIE